MTEQCRFQLKQIVWAKVPQHPWWPGRIVKQLRQSDQLIHRIHFFGDSSFCYLANEQLLDFGTEFPPPAQEISLNLQLRKPIQLATAANRKMQMPFKPQQLEELKNQQVCSMQQQHQENTHEVKGTQTAKQEDLNQFQSKLTDIANVTEETVTDVLSSRYLQQLKSRKACRKQYLTLNHILAQTLLQKYKLSDEWVECNRKPVVARTRRPIRKPKHRKARMGKSLTTSSIFQQCVRKLNKEIQKSFQGSQGRAFAVRMVERAERECGRGSDEFRQIFRSMLMWSNRAKPITMNNFEELMIGVWDAKKEDEDKSKATQIGLNPDLP